MTKTTPTRGLCCQIASRMEVLIVGYIRTEEFIYYNSGNYAHHDQKQVLLIMEAPPEFSHEGAVRSAAMRRNMACSVSVCCSS